MLLITAFIHTSQLAFPPTGNKECHAFWTVKVVQLWVHLQQSDAAGSGQQVGTRAQIPAQRQANPKWPLWWNMAVSDATCSLGKTCATPTFCVASENSKAF